MDGLFLPHQAHQPRIQPVATSREHPKTFSPHHPRRLVLLPLRQKAEPVAIRRRPRQAKPIAGSFASWSWTAYSALLLCLLATILTLGLSEAAPLALAVAHRAPGARVLRQTTRVLLHKHVTCVRRLTYIFIVIVLTWRPEPLVNHCMYEST